MLKQMLTAEDLSIILKRFKFDDSKVSIIGCPEHLFKSLLEDKRKMLKAYICHIKEHWFTIFYVKIKRSKFIITWDSFGGMLPFAYRSKILEFNSDIIFKYCSLPLQKDSHSCGLFCITFILLIFECYNNDKIQFLENIDKIQKRNVIQKLNNIKKTL